MTTELVKYEQNQFLALGGGDEELQRGLEAAQECEEFSPSDLTRVSVPTGGGTTWTIPGVVEESTKAIVGIFVHTQKYGVLWPSDEPTEGASPVLRTFNLETAEQVGPIPGDMVDALEPHRISDENENAEGPQVFDWRAIPYTQWGSGKGGIGKRAKEQRLVAILRSDALYPIIIRIPPGSLTRWKTFFIGLTEAVRGPYWRSVIKMELEKTTSKGGQSFAQIVPSLVGILSPADGMVIHLKYTSVLGSMRDRVADLIDRDQQEADDIFG